MALESEDLKELVKLMVESEVISIMDEGLGEQIDILVSPLEHSGVKSNLDGANAKCSEITTVRLKVMALKTRRLILHIEPLCI